MKKIFIVCTLAIAALSLVAAPPNPERDQRGKHRQSKAVTQKRQPRAKVAPRNNRPQTQVAPRNNRPHAKAAPRAKPHPPKPVVRRPPHRPAPAHFRGWRRGRVVHASYRSCWVGNIWYDAYGYPCYSPEYLAVTPVADTVVYTVPGTVVTPVQPTTVIVNPPPPPPKRPGPVTRLLNKLL